MEMLLRLLLEPIAVLWLLLFGGAALAVSKGQWRSAFIFLMLFGGVWFAGSRHPTELLATLERPYREATIARAPTADATVMLGGVAGASSHGAFSLDLGSAADRVLTAAELVRQGKAGVLVLGGGGGWLRDGSNWQEGRLLASWLQAWNIASTNLVSLPVCANTHEESLVLHQMAEHHGWRQIHLVTSASHMKRAEALFRNGRITIIPVACDFTALGELERDRPFALIPREKGFEHLRLYLHEVLGWWYYSWRGRL